MCGDDRKEFGLESFISPTLLSNMREKDLRKAISYHLKKIQSLLEPRQKVDTDCLVMVCSDSSLLVQLVVIALGCTLLQFSSPFFHIFH